MAALIRYTALVKGPQSNGRVNMEASQNNAAIIPSERIERAIFFLRRQKVMLSPHLADLYGVEVRALVQAVKRNRERFPKDFMFQVSRAEFANLKSQFVISSVRPPPYYVFRPALNR